MQSVSNEAKRSSDLLNAWDAAKPLEEHLQRQCGTDKISVSPCGRYKGVLSVGFSTTMLLDDTVLDALKWMKQSSECELRPFSKDCHHVVANYRFKNDQYKIVLNGTYFDPFDRLSLSGTPWGEYKF